MENSIYLGTRETLDTIYLQAFIRDTAVETPLSEIVAYVERSLMAYVVNNWLTERVVQYYKENPAIYLAIKRMSN